MLPASLDALSRLRVRTLSEFGWGRLSGIDNEFAEWDSTLARFAEHDATVLWFEHDLGDQLQT